mmetsp:Transcript_148243/g.412856  ORF Transcript_148243/g.412856 Transcript_148243/m.412856 type:complete len:245 (+) Transcript_148243:391-1125(+)
MREQLEEEVPQVGSQNVQAAPAGDIQRPRVLVVLLHSVEEKGRQGHGSSGQQEHRHVHLTAPRAEGLLLAEELAIPGCHPTRKEGHAEHQQEVRQNTAHESALHDLNLARAEGLDREYHLHRIPESRIQQASNGLVLQPRGQLFGRIAHELRQRDHHYEVEPETKDIVPLPHIRCNGKREGGKQPRDGVLENKMLQALAIAGFWFPAEGLVLDSFPVLPVVSLSGQLALRFYELLLPLYLMLHG